MPEKVPRFTEERVIGPYRLLGKLGEGGMGVVYQAEQLEPVRRAVAVKIVRAGLDSQEVVKRFEAERQALAVMDHPSIATVLDTGNTEDGRPYFVMELVEGVALTEYADAHRLGVRARVELFAQVCRAVQHAHAKGVIHRDLKPSNILVSEVDGRALPRIIDFGIAKAVTPDTEDGAGWTRAEDVLGTPAYMSPEQVHGARDVDVRSDIYSLGIVLYELLVGALPHPREAYRGVAAYVANLQNDPPTVRARLASLGDTQQTIAAARGVEPRTLRRSLQGDLEWIVAKATRRDPEVRYETASGLALDLDRHLTGHPVSAGPPSAAYRMRKFAGRHVVGVSVSATAGAALVAFGIWQTVQTGRVRRARDLADARRGQAEHVLDFMLTDLRGKLEPLGRLDIMDDVGNEAMTYFAALPAEEFTDSELLTRSQALYQIGSVRLDQGDLPAADSAFQEALRLAEALNERDPENTDWLFGVGQAEFWAGEAARRRDDLDGALAHFERYLQRSEELSARDSTNLTWLLEVAYGHTNVGAIDVFRGELEGAADHMAKSLEIKEVVADASPDDTGRRYDLARGWFNLAAVQEGLGRLHEAAASLERDIDLKQSILSEQPANSVVLTTLADSENTLGRLRWVLGDEQAAAELFDSAYRRISALVAQDPANARWLRSQGMALGAVAGMQLGRGDLRAALAGRARQVTILEAASRMNPEQEEWARDLARARAARGEALLAAGSLAAALDETGRAVATFDAMTTASGTDREVRDRVDARIMHGRALWAVGRDAEARQQWESAAAELRPEVDGARAPRHEAMAALVEALTLLGRADEAVPYVEQLRAMGYSESALSYRTQHP